MTKRLYNPLSKDFSYTWFDDHNSGHVLTLPALDYTELPDYQADFMAKHLIDEVIQVRGVKKNWDLDRQELLAELFI